MNFENKFRNITMSNAQERDRYQHHEFISDRDHEVDQSNTDDIVYYNFEVQNLPTETEAKDLVFDVNRIEPILKTPSEYEYAVERFSCPSTFPIYIQDEKKFPLKVRLVLRDTITGGITYETQAFNADVYDALGGFILPPDLPQNPNLITNGIYDYQALVTAVNYALQEAGAEFDDDQAPGRDLAGVNPFLRYDEASGNFTLYAPTEAHTTNVFFDLGRLFPVSYPFPPGVTNNPVCEIQFNDNLAKLFNGLFSWENREDGWKTIVIQETLGKPPQTFNAIAYYYSTTQWDVRPSMEQFKKIVFNTDSVPVRDELLGEQRSVTQRQLFDYVLSNRLNDKKNINFFPQYLKWNNLESQTEMRRINMRVYLEYFDGSQYPLRLQPGEIFNAKLIFRKKKTTKVKDVSKN